jgi:hypothetical protein
MQYTVHSLKAGGLKISMEIDRDTDEQALHVAELVLAAGERGLVMQGGRRVGRVRGLPHPWS